MYKHPINIQQVSNSGRLLTSNKSIINRVKSSKTSNYTEYLIKKKRKLKKNKTTINAKIPNYKQIEEDTNISDFESQNPKNDTITNSSQAQSTKKNWTLINEYEKKSYNNYLKLNNTSLPVNEKSSKELIGDIEPLDIFKQLFSDMLFSHIHKSTNLHIKDTKKNRKRNSVLKDTNQIKKKFTVNEIKIFIGMKLFMSLNNVQLVTGK